MKSEYRIMYYVRPLKPKHVFRLLDPRGMVIWSPSGKDLNIDSM